MSTFLTLIRHGETEWNRLKRWQGHEDIPLNEDGENQARAAAQFLAAANITRVMSSDLIRAHHTAQLINQFLRLPFINDERLREIHVGDVQGMTTDNIQEYFPDLHSELLRDAYANVQFPNGESRYQAGERLGQALQSIADTYPDEHVLICTHGGVIRMALYYLLNFAESATPIHNCSLTRLVYDSASQQWAVLDFAVAPEKIIW